MTDDDLETVAAIEQTAYEFPWTLQIFRDCLRAGYDCFVLADGAAIFGYFVLAVAAEEGHVLNIAVAPAYQGQGIGKRLMKRLLDLARWHRADRVFLEVRPSNPRAIGLYYQLGFLEIGRRPRYYPARDGREDAMVLALDLIEPNTAAG
ncbi:ribosomal-protein-alanine N-acetyltransferase [Ahniella affigens]|uniref:[Ribosomal protein bS18]-alanine N-acetyltransferase n=2 Tax=Ahniella affigens TaxID=2021234 RepID=A0A2P1PYT7_9GAMM|nr:ribosomal-protein-alanine N-acetyltransferase [Ahniella affigens]